MPHYRLIGGHSRGRVVVFDTNPPASLRVAYREPSGLDDFPADPDAVTFGVDTYDLVIIPVSGRGQGPCPRAYVYHGSIEDHRPDVPK